MPRQFPAGPFSGGNLAEIPARSAGQIDAIFRRGRASGVPLDSAAVRQATGRQENFCQLQCRRGN